MHMYGALVVLVLAAALCSSEKYRRHFWQCDFDGPLDHLDNYCGAVSSVRQQKHNQYTRHWNVIHGQTTTGATIDGEKTGPKDPEGHEFKNKYMAYESSPSEYDGGKDAKVSGTVTFSKIKLLGRKVFVVSGNYHAYGSDSNMVDLDVSLSTGHHMDLSGKSKNRYTWIPFRMVVNLTDTSKYGHNVETIDITFTAKSCGCRSDYAVDNLKLSDLEISSCSSNNCVDSTEVCALVGNGHECQPRCRSTGQICGPKSDHRCYPILNRVSKCSCAEGEEKQCGYENKQYEEPICYKPIVSCSFEYGGKDDCILSKDFCQRFADPQLAKGPYWPAEKYGYIFTKGGDEESKIELGNLMEKDIWDGEHQLTFFYLINDDAHLIKEFSVNIGDEKHIIEINRMLAYRWVYYAVPLPSRETPMITITIAFYGKNAEVNIDSIKIIKKVENQIQVVFPTKTKDKTCVISKLDSQYTEKESRSVAYVSKVTFGEPTCSCPATYIPENLSAQIVCHSGVPDTLLFKACVNDDIVGEKQLDCNGHNTVCQANLCVCKDGYRSDILDEQQSILGKNHPGLQTHICVPRSCVNNPCLGNSLCSDSVHPTSSHVCACANGTSVGDADFCDATAEFQMISCTYESSANCSNINSLGTAQTGNATLFRNVSGMADFFVSNKFISLYDENTLQFTLNSELDLVCRMEVKGDKDHPQLFISTDAAAEPTQIQISAIYTSKIFYPKDKSFTLSVQESLSSGNNGNGNIFIQNIECFERPPNPCDNAATNPCSDYQAHCAVDPFNVTNAICTCNHGFEGDALKDGTKCRAMEQIKLCHDCSGPNQHCVHDACECKPGFGFNDQKKCVPLEQCKDATYNFDCKGGLCMGDGICMCPPGYFARQGSGCSHHIVGECSPNKECSQLGAGGKCDVCNAQCKCNKDEEYFMVKRDNGTYFCDRHGAVKEAFGKCSKSCGEGGVQKKEWQCPRQPLGIGFPCRTDEEFTEPKTRDCKDLPDCPRITDKCSIRKSCTRCENVVQYTEYQAPGRDDLGIDYEHLQSKLFQFLTMYNKLGVNQMCQAAMCDEDELRLIIFAIEKVMEEINGWNDGIMNAMSIMEGIIDCHSSNDNDHNDRFWTVYEKLCELHAYKPHALADLQLKINLVKEEKERCNKRSDLHKLMNTW